MAIPRKFKKAVGAVGSVLRGVADAAQFGERTASAGKAKQSDREFAQSRRNANKQAQEAIDATLIKGVALADRPGAAARGAITEGARTRNLEGVKRGAKRGITGEESYPGRDLPGVRRLPDRDIIPLVGWSARDIVGGGAELVADPTNLLPVVGFGGDALKLGTKAAAKAGVKSAQRKVESEALAKVSSRLGGREPRLAGAAGVDPPVSRVTELFDVRPVVEGLRRSEKALNLAKRIVRKPQYMEDAIATPHVREWERIGSVTDSVSTDLEQTAMSIARPFKTDGAGQITELSDEAFPLGPTIQDVAARYPMYAQRLTPEQEAALMTAREQSEKFTGALNEMGIPVGIRRDIMAATDSTLGGFYLPRGDTIEKAAARIRVRGLTGGRKGFQKPEKWQSMAEGIAGGDVYEPFPAAMRAFAEDVGDAVADKYVVTLLANRGIDSTAAMRRGKDITERVTRHRSKLAGVRSTLFRQTARAASVAGEAARASKVAGRYADRALTADLKVADISQGINPAALQEARAYTTATIDEVRKIAVEIGDNSAVLRGVKGEFGTLERAAVSAQAALEAEIDRLEKFIAAKSMPATIADVLPSQLAATGPTARSTIRKAATADAKEYVEYIKSIGRLHRLSDKASNAAEKVGRKVDDLIERKEVLSDLDVAARADLIASRQSERVATSLNLKVKVAETELRVLSGVQKVMETHALRAAKRGQDLTTKMQNSKIAISKLEGEWIDMQQEWDLAKQLASLSGRGYHATGFSQLQGHAFPDAVANVVNRVLKKDDPLSGKGSALSHVVAATNHLMRMLNAGMDLSGMSIQALLGLATDPKAYGTALRVSLKSLYDSQAMSKYLAASNERAVLRGLPTSQSWAAVGQRLAAANTELTAGYGINRISRAPVISNFNRQFGVMGDVLRNELSDGMAEMLVNSGRKLDHAAMREIAHGSNLMTGWARSRFGGEIGDFALFAPRFFQSQLELLVRAFSDSSITGKMARRSMQRLLGGGIATTVAANEYAKAQGWTDKEFNYLDPFIDGQLNPNFMRIRLGGQDVSLFGPWDSLLKGIVYTASGDGSDGALHGRTYLLRSKASPVLSLGWDLATGESSIGENTRTPEYVLRAFMPFAYSNIGNEGVLTTAIGGTGIKASPVTVTEALNEIARREGFDSWGQTPGMEQDRILDQYPGLKDRRAEQLEARNDNLSRAIKAKKGIDARRKELEARDAAALNAGSLTKKQFSDLMSQRMRDAAVSYDSVRSLLSVEERESQTPEEQALDAYYLTFTQSEITPDGPIDWDKQARLESAVMANLSPAQRAYVEQRRRAEHAPEVQWFFDAKQAVNESGYYDTYNKALESVRAPEGITKPRSYAELVSLAETEPDTRTRRRYQSMLNRVEKRSARARQVNRRENRELDEALLLMGRVTEPKNRELAREMRGARRELS